RRGLTPFPTRRSSDLDYVEANGTAFVDNFSGMGPVILPIVIAGVGIIASIIGTFLVRTNKSDASEADVQKVLNLGNWTAIILTRSEEHTSELQSRENL